MTNTISIRNKQHARSVNTALLRRLTARAASELLPGGRFDIGICLVSTAEMTRLNETFLKHSGATDVITFDYSDANPSSAAGAMPALHGEIFICIDEAVSQARRFGTIWQEELARYVVHGLLHLAGFDDVKPAARRMMKSQEKRVLGLLAAGFPLRQLARGASRHSARTIAAKRLRERRRNPRRGCA
jgi:rRNA maturation RNase YbeY